MKYLGAMPKKRKLLPEDARILFGSKLRVFRQRRGLSQEKLSFEAGLDRSYVGGVERGERNIALLNIFKLARALKVHPKELLDV